MKKLFSLALILLLSLSARVFAYDYSILYDEADLLEEEDAELLWDMMESVGSEYDMGIYIYILKDFTDFGYSNIEDFSEVLYRSEELGIDEEDTGLMLVMSMEDRDFDICAHGTKAHYTFTDYGKKLLQEDFIPYFKKNDWIGGFKAYVEGVKLELYSGAQGEPVDTYGNSKSSNYGEYREVDAMDTILPCLLIGLAFGFIVALITVLVFRSQMKTVRLAKDAGYYVDENAVNITKRSDMFTHRDVSRHKIQTSSNSSGGGTHISSGGFSHSSGKF